MDTTDISVNICFGCCDFGKCEQCDYARDNDLPEGTLEIDYPKDYRKLKYIFTSNTDTNEQYKKLRIFIDLKMSTFGPKSDPQRILYLKNIFLAINDYLFKKVEEVFDTSSDKYMIIYLVECGLDVNTCNRDRWTLLRFAECYENYELAKQLVKLGADVNSKDYAGVSILYAAAAINNNRRITKLLLKHGANPNKYFSNSQYTILHYIIKNTTWRWNSKIIILLLKYGADPYILDGNGKSTIDLCSSKNKEMYQKLVDVYCTVLDYKEPE